MELNVRLPSGAQVIIVTTPDSTVGDLKEAIQNVNGVSPIRQELSLGKKQALMNRTVLAEAGIVNGDEVNMHVHLRGGCGCCFSLCKALVLVLLSPFIFLVMLLGILVWLILLPCNCIGKCCCAPACCCVVCIEEYVVKQLMCLPCRACSWFWADIAEA